MLKMEKEYWLTIAGSLIVGLATGISVSVYRYLVENSANAMNSVYITACRHWYYVPVLLAGLILAAVLCRYLASRDEFLSGSGVPQIQLEMNDFRERCWHKLIVLKILSGVLCLGAGLSLGREGPSVQIGAMTAKVVQLKTRIKLDHKLLLGCGAGAGLAAALNAPLAGTMFAIEELYKKLSPLTLVCVLLSAISSTMVVERVFGIAPLLSLKEFRVPILSDYPVFVVIGIVTGVCGYLFCVLCLWSIGRSSAIGNKTAVYAALFILSGIVGLIQPDLLGVREGSLMHYADVIPVLWVIAGLFIIKWLFTTVSIASSAPGGIFVPLIGVGILLGLTFQKILIALGISYPTEMIVALVIGGYFVAVIRAPLTAIVLVAEITDSFVCFLPLAVVAVVSMLTADLFNSRPIYESIIERMEKR